MPSPFNPKLTVTKQWQPSKDKDRRNNHRWRQWFWAPESVWGRCWDPWSVNNRNMTSEETVSWPLICCCHYWFVWSNSTGSRVNTGEQVQHWWDSSVECGWGLCPAPDSRHCTNCTTLSRLIWLVTRLGSWSNMWTVQAWYRGVEHENLWRFWQFSVVLSDDAFIPSSRSFLFIYSQQLCSADPDLQTNSLIV